MTMQTIIQRHWNRVLRWRWHMTDNVPEEIRGAEPFLIEAKVSTLIPVPLVARPDAVFALDDGDLVVTDTKHRAKLNIDWADVIQLTTVAVILRHSSDTVIAGRTVRDYGYIRLVHRGNTRWEKVTLLPEKAIIALWFMSWVMPTGCLAKGPLNG